MSVAARLRLQVQGTSFLSVVDCLVALHSCLFAQVSELVPAAFHGLQLPCRVGPFCLR